MPKSAKIKSREIFAGNLKKIREMYGMSQYKMGAALGLKRHNLAAYEEGRAYPAADIFACICNSLKIKDPYGFVFEKDFHNRVNKTRL